VAQREDILNARHLVATAAGNIAACSAQVARALAWQRGQEVSVIADLETTVKALQRAERELVDAINELRIATKE
jgi:ferric-dicitrate binding protein FerR (iron transport regulator)